MLKGQFEYKNVKGVKIISVDKPNKELAFIITEITYINAVKAVFLNIIIDPQNTMSLHQMFVQIVAKLDTGLRCSITRRAVSA